MKNCALLVSLSLAISTYVFAAAPPEQWVARYNGPDNSDDFARNLTIDSLGNIYVTGYSIDSNGYADYATIKYDPNGNQLWAKRYNGPGNSDDYAVTLAVDNSGNVYVTGYSYGNETGNDCATIKYAPDGNQLWVARYNGPDNSDDAAVALKVDSSGNVYVTGYSYGTDGVNSDYATIKYAPNGNQLWAKRYNGPENSDDGAVALAVDSLGNVYVTGTSYGNNSSKYATVKYDTNGNQLWVANYNEQENSNEQAVNLAIDSSGNVYVTGNSYISEIGNDYATVKYGPDGNQLWVARYNGTGNSNDIAVTLAIDSSGNVYVTGYSDSNSTDTDYATIKYDTNGSQLWAARYNGPGDAEDAAQALALDSSGNVYVTGYSYSESTGNDYATVKYGPNGNELWVKSYNGPVNGEDVALALTVDTSDNVYLTGYSAGSDNYDYVTIKYSQQDISNGPVVGDLTGDRKVNFADFSMLASHWLEGVGEWTQQEWAQQEWAARYNGPGNSEDTAVALIVDSSGNVYVTGYSFGTDNINADYATIKYGPDGNQLWAARYNGPGNSDDYASALAVDSSGNVYVTGTSYGTDGINADYATIKYGPDGNQLWAARYNGPGNSEDTTVALTVDGSGNVYVTGSSYGNETYSDYATVKYSSNGTQLWVALYNGPGNSDDYAVALAIDSSRNVYVTGYSYGANDINSDYATIKYGPDGNQLWVARYNGPGNSEDTAVALAVDSSGNVYVTGYSYDNNTFDDYATVKYSPDGQQLWVTRYNGIGNSSDYVSSVSVDNSSNVYVTGQSMGISTDFDYSTIKYLQQGYCATPIAGDLNNDCKVDVEDFALMASHWLESNYALQEDCQ
jgi:uncharacterized delta-60 repeat protein